MELESENEIETEQDRRLSDLHSLVRVRTAAAKAILGSHSRTGFFFCVFGFPPISLSIVSHGLSL